MQLWSESDNQGINHVVRAIGSRHRWAAWGCNELLSDLERMVGGWRVREGGWDKGRGGGGTRGGGGDKGRGGTRDGGMGQEEGWNKMGDGTRGGWMGQGEGGYGEGGGHWAIIKVPQVPWRQRSVVMLVLKKII